MLVEGFNHLWLLVHFIASERTEEISALITWHISPFLTHGEIFNNMRKRI